MVSEDVEVLEVELNQALTYVQGRGSIHYIGGLRRPIDVWSTEKLPIQVRRAIRGNREQIVAWMREGSIKVCPSPWLHRRAWKRGYCAICRRMEPYLRGVIDGAA